MKIQQISVFLENKPGHLSQACKVLAEAGINLVTLSLADTEQFGILRIIVKEWEKARDILQQAGFVVKTTEVIATAVDDQPGGLQKILDIIGEAGLNIEYMYAFTYRCGGQAVLMFRFNNADAAIAALRAREVNVIGNINLFKRTD